MKPRPPAAYHARVNCRLLDVSSDAGHEGVSVLEIGVEVGLRGEGKSRLEKRLRMIVGGESPLWNH